MITSSRRGGQCHGALDRWTSSMGTWGQKLAGAGRKRGEDGVRRDKAWKWEKQAGCPQGNLSWT